MVAGDGGFSKFVVVLKQKKMRERINNVLYCK